MGIDFRGSTYVRRVRIGKRTVKDGEAVAIWNRSGNHHQVEGPALCRLWYSTIRFLNRHTAEASQYLRVRHRDGTIEHIRGPKVLYENPVHHLGVTVESALQLPSATDYVVLMQAASSKEGSAAPSRVVKPGPLVYFPEAAEHVKAFDWRDKGGAALSEGQRVIHIGKTVPRELKFQVQGADNHSVKISIGLRIRLVGINEVLAVQDPISECDSAVEAAILSSVQGIGFGHLNGSLLEHVRAAVAADKFNSSLSSELKQRAACELVSFAITGVEPSAELQKLLSKEDEVAAAKVRDQVADAALAAATARQEREQALENARQKHELKLAEERHRAELAQHDLEARRHLDHLKELKGMGVDLTEYLVHGPRAQMAAAAAKAATASKAAGEPSKAKPSSFFCL